MKKSLRFLSVLKNKKGSTFFVFMLLMLATSSWLIVPYLIGNLVDEMNAGKDFRQMTFGILVILGMNLLTTVFHQIRFWWEVNHLDFDIHINTSRISLGKIFSFSIGQHKNYNSGLKTSVITRGEGSIMALIYELLYNVVPSAIQILLIVGGVFFLSWELGLILLGSVIVFIGISLYYNVKNKELIKHMQDGYSDNDKLKNEIIRNIDVIAINAQENKVSTEYFDDLTEVWRREKNLWNGYIGFNSLRIGLSHLFRAAFLLYAVYLVYIGVYGPGLFVTVFVWSQAMFMALMEFTWYHRRMLQAYAAIEKYYRMYDLEADLKNGKKKLEKDGIAISFDKVSYKYPARRIIDPDDEANAVVEKNHREYALHNLSFEIRKGEHVAIVGSSGAGKSTLAELIKRSSDPSDGVVRVNGLDLKSLDLGSYRQQIGVVDQDVKLFDKSLAYNIKFGLNGQEKDLSASDMERVAREASIYDFVAGLDDGFDTMIGEKGVKLSGGERQRVGIARALAKDPKLLILDEATSSLDANNELIIRDAIRNATKGRTAIIIAHRLSTIKYVDHIIMLEEGKKVGEGTHEELLADCEAYRNLMQHQIQTL